MNYEILISISLGDNFQLQDEFLSKDCKTTAVLEAKFNDEVLQSDPIEINSANPELATELGFRLNKKDFHQFRTERKSIKLQCFVEYSTLAERHYIGYMILHLRDAQEYSPDPKYKWHVLLNPKYKGSSVKRPQLFMAFMVNKLKDDSMSSSQVSASLTDSMCESLENHFTRPLKKESEALLSSFIQFDSSAPTSELDSNLKVKFKNKMFFIWDENKCKEKDCGQMYAIQIQIDKPRNLLNLMGEKAALKDQHYESAFYFKYSLLGKQIKATEFSDIVHFSDFKKHKFQFYILTFDKKMLKSYFESYPTIEIQFCCLNKTTGFVTINLLRLFENNLTSLDGDYMIVPEDESVYVKEPFPVVSLSITISQLDQQFEATTNISDSKSNKKVCDSLENSSTQQEASLTKLIGQAAGLNHYYIAIDLRTIRLENAESCQILFQPFYLQFSYAFFGITDFIKTYPAIQFREDNPQEAITIPHGFCGFNFATTLEKLQYTFTNIPFIVQLILEEDDTLLGTAELDLSCLLNQKEATCSIGDASDNFVNTLVHVQDELNDQISEIQVVMFLQEIQNLSSSNDIRQIISSNLSIPMGDDLRKNELISSINDMIIETAHDLELWKEDQMKLFKNRLKQKESDFLNTLSDERHRDKKKQLSAVEEDLRQTLDSLIQKEEIITEKELQLEARQKELDERFHKLDREIDEAISEIREQYEEKMSVNRNQIKCLEQDKCKHQERIYQLERKTKDKDLKIQELESKLQDLTHSSLTRRTPPSQRAASLTRSVGPNSRKIVATRDSDLLSKSMVEAKVPELPSATKSPTTKPPLLKSKISAPLSRPASIAPDSKSSIPTVKQEPTYRIRDRQELMRKGVTAAKDPPLRKVAEIDKRIQNYRLNNSKRV